MLALSKLLQLEPCIVLPYLDSVSSTVSFDSITTILPSRTSIKNHVQSVAARRPNPYAQPYVSHLVPQISKIEYLRFEYSMQYVGLYKRRNERIFWVSNLFCRAWTEQFPCDSFDYFCTVRGAYGLGSDWSFSFLFTFHNSINMWSSCLEKIGGFKISTNPPL